MAENCGKLYLLPLSVVILFPLTFIISYSIAVGLGHTNAIFAYISNTGTLPPEMNIFGQFLNIAGVLVGLTAYVRYKQIELFFIQQTDTEEDELKLKKVKKWNKIGLSFGLIAALGSSVVGNFQETNVLAVHGIGAWMSFGCGSIFLIIQAYFSFRMVPFFVSKRLARLRLALSIICLILFFLTLVTGLIARIQFRAKGKNKNILKWKPEDGGWGFRVTSVAAEWTMAGLLDLYFITFVFEFKKIKYRGPQFSFVQASDLDSKPTDENGNHEELANTHVVATTDDPSPSDDIV